VTARLPTCLLFDQDGTIFDSLPGVEFSVRCAFEACHLPLRRLDLRRMIGPPIRTILAQAGEVEQGTVLDALERAFRTSYDGEGWQKTVCFPEAVPVLKTLRARGHRLFVVSNKPRHISLRILEKVNLLELFEEIVTADSRVPAYRGKEEMLETLMARHGLTSHDCLFAGDTMEDAKAAATAGMGFAYMTHGYGDVESTPSVPVALQLKCFSDFLPLVLEEPVCD
jgi:phosphoglycolate phosphatase